MLNVIHPLRNNVVCVQWIRKCIPLRAFTDGASHIAKVWSVWPTVKVSLQSLIQPTKLKYTKYISCLELLTYTFVTGTVW